MATKKKLLQAAAGSAGGAVLDVESVFSTYVYEGDGTYRDIINGIDLSNEGGMVWVKNRNGNHDHIITDTERGVNKGLSSSSTGTADTATSRINGFLEDGFSVGNSYKTNNGSGNDYASWTFRKAPKFFDVVTWTGDSASDRAISHNLGCVPGMIIVKRTNASEDWGVWHRSVHSNTSKVLYLNQNVSLQTSTHIFGATNPTDSNFYVGDHPISNNNNDTYVAYVFAHNNGDGEFGADGDADIIKCGSYTPDGSGNATINLGFEPQWLLIKCSSQGGTYRGWAMFDAMRGVPTGSNTSLIEANLSDAEKQWFPNPRFTSTGFETTSADQSDTVNTGGQTYIYMAIRRGTKVPESATEVFEVATRTAGLPSFEAPFAVDMGLVRKGITASGGVYNASRLTGTKFLYTNATDAEANDNGFVWDFMDGWANDGGTSSEVISWMWKRAPGYFDVVAYTGDSNAGRTVSHNLTVAPEMMWVKVRNAVSKNWMVYHKDLDATAPEDKYLTLNTTSGLLDGRAFWNDTAPTSTEFTVGTHTAVNASSSTYIAYLFASLDGISKVGSYTGNGTSQTINCGFTSGARFVLIKKSSGTGDWWVFDTERGIVSGNDPALNLNTTDAEDSSYDMIDPASSGFAVTTAGYDLNESGSTYIFYAIA